jgi:hypothetical protein
MTVQKTAGFTVRTFAEVLYRLCVEPPVFEDWQTIP